ncbi:hypothetical protein [Vulgatibacter sp.]|uniref:hypothetical protein n=1 Tax=Vulgatibacter sp. TaxID=1971226 RepID=UPI0035673DB5
MKIKLEPSLKMLQPAEVRELAMSAHANLERCSKVLERLRKDEEAQRARIASFWKERRSRSQDAVRLEREELAEALWKIRENAKAELDGLVARAGELTRQAEAQAPFYESPLQLLDRAALGESRRSEYMLQLRDVGPLALGRYGQVAVGTATVALGAAVAACVDRLPAADRPFTSGDLARALLGEAWEEIDEAIRVTRHRGQAVINAVRTFRVMKGGALSRNLADALNRLSEDPKLVERILDGGDEEQAK